MKREKEERRLLKNQRKLVIYFILIILLAGMYRTNYEQMWAQNTTEFFAELTEISSRFLASHLSDIETEGEVLTIGNTENASAMLSENEPKAIGSIVIRAWLLNVREEPNGTILGTVAKEEVHPYYEERDGWVRIKFNGGYGYVAGGYGDRYDPSGNIIAFANIPESTPAEEQSVQAQTESQETQTENIQVQTENAQVQTEIVRAQELCQRVLNQVTTPQMTDMEKVIAVNQYLCDFIIYDIDYYKTEDVLTLGKARCQGYANAFKNIMNLAGVPTDYVRGYTAGNGSSTHAWNRVLIDGKYYCVDVTWNDGVGNNNWLLIPEDEFNRERIILEYNPSWTK